MTEWRHIPSAPDYQVSSDGRVRRATGHKLIARWAVGRELSPFAGPAGYLRVYLYSGLTRTKRDVAHVVAEAFLGPRPAGHEINHKNGIKTDNTVQNLEYVTKSANVRHAFALGLNRREKGGRSPVAKLTDTQAGEVRELYRSGLSQTVLAQNFGVSQGTISNITRGRTYPAAT